jgi:hypothetical protein
MIKTLIFTVAGNTNVDDDIIFCNRLVFTGPTPKLVIKPKKDSTPGAQRLLKIVADTIDTQTSSDPEITYSLAKEFEFQQIIPNTPKVKVEILEIPFTDSGLDPETQATPGDDGEPNFSHGAPPLLPPDTASPNFDFLLDPTHWIGAFPKASNGGNGKAGGKGKNGENGSNAPVLEIWTKEIVGPKLKLDLRGQEGGDGGLGGNGQFGGNGQQGSGGVPGVDSNWIGVPTAICAQKPGLGGDGGAGGDAGCGGDGGDGGDGGFIKIFYTAGTNVSNFEPLYSKGKGGKAGPPGIPGKGGKAGPPGLNIVECSSALGSSNGPDGSRCFKGNSDLPGLAIDGEDGEDGYYLIRQVANIPRVPFF